MYRRILPLIIFGLITVVYADSAIQIDWSRGPRVWGPVIEFGEEFCFGSGVAYSSTPGDIILGLIDYIVGHTIAEDFEGATSVYSEDINGDGDMAVLGTAYLEALQGSVADDDEIQFPIGIAALHG